jgi:hypothetical protein
MAASRTQRHSTARPRIWRGVVNTRGRGHGIPAFGRTRSETARTAPSNRQSNLTKKHGVPTHRQSRPMKGPNLPAKRDSSFASGHSGPPIG